MILLTSLIIKGLKEKQFKRKKRLVSVFENYTTKSWKSITKKEV